MSWFQKPLALGAKPAKLQIPFVVEDLLPAGYLAILCGEPKTGKTALATSLALAVATGTPFLGHKTNQGAVLWICFEESPEERAALLQEVPDEMRNPEGREVPLYTVYGADPIDTQTGIVQMLGGVRQIKAKLVVVDSLHASHSGRSLGDGWAARRTLKALKEFCDKQGVPVLVLHHIGGTKHRRRVAESAQLAATASMFWLLERLEYAGSGRKYALKSQGRGAFANRDLKLWSRSPLEYEAYPEDETRDPEPKGSVVEAAILQSLSIGPQTSADIVTELWDYKERVVKNAITRLFKTGVIVVESIVDRLRVYKLAEKPV